MLGNSPNVPFFLSKNVWAPSLLLALNNFVFFFLCSFKTRLKIQIPSSNYHWKTCLGKTWKHVHLSMAKHLLMQPLAKFIHQHLPRYSRHWRWLDEYCSYCHSLHNMVWVALIFTSGFFSIYTVSPDPLCYLFVYKMSSGDALFLTFLNTCFRYSVLDFQLLAARLFFPKWQFPPPYTGSWRCPA